MTREELIGRIKGLNVELANLRTEMEIADSIYENAKKNITHQSNIYKTERDALRMLLLGCEFGINKDSIKIEKEGGM